MKNLRILVPSKILVSLFYYWKNQTTSPEAQLSNFQDPSQRITLTLNMLQESLIYKRASGNQHLDVLRVLVPPHILVPLAISAKCDRDCMCSTDKYSRHHIPEGF